MIMFSDFTTDALMQLKIMSIDQDEAAAYVRQSVPFADGRPEFNRRYEHLVFRVMHSRVEAVGIFKDVTTQRRDSKDAQALALLQKLHAYLEDFVDEAEQHWRDTDLEELNSLIDETEKFIQGGS